MRVTFWCALAMGLTTGVERDLDKAKRAVKRKVKVAAAGAKKATGKVDRCQFGGPAKNARVNQFPPRTTVDLAVLSVR
jgi:hypothetical protein